MAKNLDTKEEQVLLALLRASNSSDREIGQKLGLSQPTVTRIRNRLERQGIILQYSVLPSMATIGLTIMIFTLVRVSNFDSRAKIFEWIKTNPKIVFATEGEGLKENLLMISLHPGFNYYQQFLNDFRSKFGKDTSDILTYVASTNNIIKQFSFESPISEFLGNTLRKLREQRKQDESL